MIEHDVGWVSVRPGPLPILTAVHPWSVRAKSGTSGTSNWDEGKRGGYRGIVLYKIGTRVVFVHGFAKSEEDNTTPAQAEQFKDLSRIYLGLLEKALMTRLMGLPPHSSTSELLINKPCADLIRTRSRPSMH